MVDQSEGNVLEDHISNKKVKHNSCRAVMIRTHRQIFPLPGSAESGGQDLHMTYVQLYTAFIVKFLTQTIPKKVRFASYSFQLFSNMVQ